MASKGLCCLPAPVDRVPIDRKRLWLFVCMYVCVAKSKCSFRWNNTTKKRQPPLSHNFRAVPAAVCCIHGVLLFYYWPILLTEPLLTELARICCRNSQLLHCHNEFLISKKFLMFYKNFKFTKNLFYEQDQLNPRWCQFIKIIEYGLQIYNIITSYSSASSVMNKKSSLRFVFCFEMPIKHIYMIYHSVKSGDSHTCCI